LNILSKLQDRPIEEIFFVTHSLTAFLGTGWTDENRTLVARGYQIWGPTTSSFCDVVSKVSGSTESVARYELKPVTGWIHTHIYCATKGAHVEIYW